MILKVDLNQEMWEWNRDSRVPLFPNCGWNQHGVMPISEAISEGSLLHDQPVMTICSNSSWTSLDFVKNCCQRASFASQTYCFVDLFLGRITTGQRDISDVTQFNAFSPPKRHRKFRKQENMKDHPKKMFSPSVLGVAAIRQFDLGNTLSPRLEIPKLRMWNDL